MKTWTRISLVTAAAALVAIGVAHAQGYRWPDLRHGRIIPERYTVDRLFERLDADHDGVITIAEYLKPLEDRFAEFDTNGDGVIDRPEAMALISKRSPADAPRMTTRMFAELDTNRDGRITRDEAEKPFRKRFAIFDLDDDGRVTRQEYIDAQPFLRVMGPAFGFGGPGGSRHGMMLHVDVPPNSPVEADES